MFIINLICFILVIIGGLNWGLIGFFNYNLVSVIFGGASTGTYPTWAYIIFAIVGLASLWCLSFFGRSTDVFGSGS